MRPLPEELLDELLDFEELELEELDLELELEELATELLDELDFELLEELATELEELEPPTALPATRIVQAAPLIVQLPSLDESKVPLAVKPKLAVLPTAMLPLLEPLVNV